YGACLSIAGLIAVFGTHAHRDQADPGASPPSLGSFVTSFRQSMANPAFRSIWMFTAVFFLAVVINSALAIHFFTWYVKISDSTKISSIQAGFYLGALTGALCWLWQAKRGLEKRTLCLLGTLGTAALLASATLLTGEGNLLGTGNYAALTSG